MLSGLCCTASFGRGCVWGWSSARLQIPSRLPVSGAEPVISEARDKCLPKKCTQSIKWKGVAVLPAWWFRTLTASPSGGPVSDGNGRDSRAFWKLPPPVALKTKGQASTTFPAPSRTLCIISVTGGQLVAALMIQK